MSTIAEKLAALSLDQLTRRRAALADYQCSMFRIGEDSNAADREHLRVMAALSALNSEIRKRKEASRG